MWSRTERYACSCSIYEKQRNTSVLLCMYMHKSKVDLMLKWMLYWSWSGPNHGKHRSLSAVVILKLFFHRTLELQYACQERPNQPCPCGQPAAQNIACISAAFRSLENDTQHCNLLSIILGLPWCKVKKHIQQCFNDGWGHWCQLKWHEKAIEVMDSYHTTCNLPRD